MDLALVAGILATATRAPAVIRYVLVVEDEQNIRDVLAELFDVDGTITVAAATVAEAKAALTSTRFDFVLTDLRLGGHRDGGLQVMAASALLSPDAAVVVLTAFPDDDYRHASARLGATHFLEKPVPLQTIATLAARAGVATAMHPTPRAAYAFALDASMTA